MNNNNHAAGHATNHVQLVLSRRALLIIMLVCCVPWILVAIMFWRIALPPNVSRPTPGASNPGKIVKGKPGHWGELEYIRIATEMPNEFAFVISSDTTPQRWFFKGYTKEQVLALFQSSKLSPEQLSSLAMPDKWEINAAGCFVKPGEEVVLGMSAHARSMIYLTLTQFQENKPQRTAFSFRPAFLDERLQGSGLSEKSIALFKSLLYQQGSFLLFADLSHALPKLTDDDERRRFIKMVSRKSTLLVHLQITPASDIERIIGYWGTGGRAKDLRALLESLAGIDGGSSIDIVHLMPPFVRQRLYTYPVISANAPVSIQDCNWTTMNFFNAEPDDRFANLDFLSSKLQADYYQIGLPEHLGDLIFLTLPSGESVHSAVYVADNIVFTKNGEAVSQPWILMKLEDLIELYAAPYPEEQTLKPLFYRQKTL